MFEQKTLLFVLIASVLLNPVVSEIKFMDESTQIKVTDVRHLMKKTYPDVYQMSSLSPEFSRFIETKPRPYTVVFFFYDSNNQEHILEFNQFALAVKQFMDNSVHLTRKIGDKLHKPLFFFGLPYHKMASDSTYIDSLGAGGASGIYISTGEEIGKEPHDLVLYNRKYLWKIQFSDGIITPKKIVEYIGEKTGVHIKYTEPLGTFLYTFGIIVIALVVLGFIYQKFFWLLVNVKVWIFVFFVGYYISSSAYIWTLLNNPKWTGIKDDQTEWIFPSIGLQHRAEGFMMGGLICSIPLLMGLLMYLCEKIESGILRRIVSYILLAAICYLFYTLEDIIKKKKHYELTWKPSDHFLKGSLRSDQGHYL